MRTISPGPDDRWALMRTTATAPRLATAALSASASAAARVGSVYSARRAVSGTLRAQILIHTMVR